MADTKFILFPRATDEQKKQDWTLNYEMLERIESAVEAGGYGFVVGMEDIEAVLLALEPMIPSLAQLRQLEELREQGQSEENRG